LGAGRLMRKHLSIDIRLGEAVSIDGGSILVILEEKSGQRARLRFEADDATTIERVRSQHNVRAQIGLGSGFKNRRDDPA
jgi:hypothetical protein